MTTSFSELPVIDLTCLGPSAASTSNLATLSKQLHDVFSTIGFAYLSNAPLSFSHDEVLRLAAEFFRMEMPVKMKLAKRSFVGGNVNTYRGYFPTQPGQLDNLKEGFEIGPPTSVARDIPYSLLPVRLDEQNVWPEESEFAYGRARMEKLHAELQQLGARLLSLLAISLDKPANFFSSYLINPLSTLRLLHYPQQALMKEDISTEPKLCCTPHTDSGILTLLHQDPTGGLEVRNASGEWISAPYIPGTLVVNIGDLLAEVSGGKFIATVHRVRTKIFHGNHAVNDRIGRLSIPFFFEPGEQCIVQSMDGKKSIVYGTHVRQKMKGWVEFQNKPHQPVALFPGHLTRPKNVQVAG